MTVNLQPHPVSERSDSCTAGEITQKTPKLATMQNEIKHTADERNNKNVN